MNEQALRILLVEDDPNLGLLISDYLASEGFAVKLCTDGESGWNNFNEEMFDACVVDVMLPQKDGFTLATQIRSENPEMPIIFLTAKSMKEDKLRAFGIGADDYITKPFDEEELSARIRAVTRRSVRTKENTRPENISLGNYQLDISNLSLRIGDEERRLTQREAELLRYLSRFPNQLVRREDILKSLWGKDDYFLGRSLDVFITKLRKYLRDDERLRIENVHGVGFMLHLPD